MSRAVNLGLAAVLAGLALPGGAGRAEAGALRVRTEITGTAAWAAATSLDAALGFQRRQSLSGSARFMWKSGVGPFGIEIHSRLAFVHGDEIPYRKAIAAFGPPPAPATLFDLTQSWHSDSDTRIVNTIDRLSFSFTTPSLVVKIGRQALTWGDGMVFRPADIVASFAPFAFDRSFKPGTDMIYAQYLFAGGADLQAIVVPRRQVRGGPVRVRASTYALRVRRMIAGIDAKLMLARERGDTLAGLGLSGALAGASWNAEYLRWRLADGTVTPSWLLNISNFGTLFGRNLSYFGEYYHDGLGVPATVPLDALPANLAKRIANGRVFFPGRNFLALGARLELTADTTLAPSAAIALSDGSTMATLVASYSLGDNTSLRFTYLQGIGKAGSEFGGRETSAGSGIYASPARAVWIQLVRYF